jgi:ribonucleoside-triphosphate reductase
VFESIKKRDERVVEFDSSKISAAIAKAGNATGEFGKKEAKKLTLRVLTLAHELQLDPAPEVEEIQDIVEAVLLDSPFFKTAKAYILYREQHAQIRQITTKANVDLVNHYIQKLDWKIKENSNMCYSLQGLNNYISSEVTSEYWLNSIYPPEIRQAHKNGDFHIHDLNLLSVYCVGWDLQDLLRQGFKGVEGKVESAPPKHLRSALGQIVNFFWGRLSIFSIPCRERPPVLRRFPILTRFWRRLFVMTSLIMMMSSRHCRNLFLTSIFRPGLDFRRLLPISPWI